MILTRAFDVGSIAASGYLTPVLPREIEGLVDFMRQREDLGFTAHEKYCQLKSFHPSKALFKRKGERFARCEYLLLTSLCGVGVRCGGRG